MLYEKRTVIVSHTLIFYPPNKIENIYQVIPECKHTTFVETFKFLLTMIKNCTASSIIKYSTVITKVLFIISLKKMHHNN